MQISGIDNEAIIQFYGQVPIIYDDWRQERKSIRLKVKNDGLYIRIWDGTAASSIDERVIVFDLKNEINLSLLRKNDNFIIQSNGRNLGSIPDHKIFADGTVWPDTDTKLIEMHKILVSDF